MGGMADVTGVLARVREMVAEGRWDELRELATADPHVAAVLHLAEGRPQDAVTCARAAGDVARNTLAVALLTSGEKAEAERILTELTAAEPANADLWFNLARASARLEHVRRALALRPGWTEALLLEARLVAGEGRVDAAVLLCLGMLDQGVDCHALLRELLATGVVPKDSRVLPHLPLAVLPGVIKSWPQVREELLYRLLRDGLLTDLELERELTRRRRDRQLSPQLAEALACHTMTNEGAFLEEPGEAPEPSDPCYPLYRPLQPGTPASALVIERHLTEPARERELQATLTTERRPDEPKSPADPVGRQYSQNPYPRWRELDDFGPPRPFAELVGPPPPGPLRVLVAGCGTGRHALTVAKRYAESEVWAVDVSAPSLAHALRQAERLGIRARFLLGDLLDLPHELPQEFSVIECVGVLHHLEDPLAGLLALRRRLAPGGWLRLGLYSRAARAGLAPARQLARATPGSLRDIRARLMRELPAKDLEFLASFADFYSLSGLRDLLLHEREMECDLEQIAAWLAAADLTFVGDPAAWKAREREDPLTFRGMYDFWTRPR